MTKIEGPPPPKKVVYNDHAHRYYMDGVMCKSVSSIAKIPTNTYNIDQWVKRTVALGMAIDRNLCEKIITDPESRELGNAVAEDALRAAKSHLKADRGTQMHKVLELMLLGQPDRLLSDQQHRDRDVLARTLDRYHLAPHEDGLAEQLVAWPHQRVGGRFDAVLKHRDNSEILTDLKTGPNAVAYPQATAIQLALYARAPWISDGMTVIGDKTEVTSFRKMPAGLNMDYAYVLLVEPDAEVGTLHEVDIRHGWRGALLALQAVEWQAKKDIVSAVLDHDPPTAVQTYADRALMAENVEELRALWREANAMGRLDSAFLAACDTRKTQLELTV